VEAAKAFEELKTVFIIVLILRHFNPALEIHIETDASGFAVIGIISQLFSEGTEAR
jgi:hypothetical protein